MSDALKQAARQALEAMSGVVNSVIGIDANHPRKPDSDGYYFEPIHIDEVRAVTEAIAGLAAALSQPEAVQVPQGWRMVPVKPTQEMLRAGTGYGLTINTWDAMLAAAPQPPAQAEPCDMGPICIGCEPRGPRGECPGAQAEVRPGFDVLVNAGALQTVRNALKRDADEGKQSRREILEELEATIRPVQAQAEARGDGPAQIADYLMAQADLCPEISPTRATLVSCAAVIRCGLYKDGGPAPAAPQAGEDIPLKMALEALTAMRERAEAAEAKLASQPMSREVIDPVEVAEAMRKRFVKLPRFSFMLGDPPSVRRVPDRYGNWLEFQTVHELFDAVHVDAALRDAGIGSGSGEGSGKGVA